MRWIFGIVFASLFYCGAPSALQEDVRAAIARLARELRTTKESSPEVFRRAVANGAPERLRNLLREATLTVLNDAPAIAPAALESRLRQVYDPWEDRWTESTGRAPRVIELSRAPNRRLLVAWLIWVGGDAAPDTLPLIEVFTQRNGRFEVGQEFRGFPRDHGMFVRLVPEAGGSLPRILLWGTKFGSNSNELAVVFVSIDRNAIRPLWSASYLGGELTELPDGIRLTFREYHKAGPRFNEVVEEWSFTAKGIERRSRKVK